MQSKYIVVTHEPRIFYQTADPFWNPVRNGFRKAAAEAQQDFLYLSPEKDCLSYNNESIYKTMESLVSGALKQKPKALVVSNPNCFIETGGMEKIVDSGTTVVSINAYSDVHYNEKGMLCHVGMCDDSCGKVMGKLLAEKSVNSILYLLSYGTTSGAIRRDACQRELPSHLKTYEVVIDKLGSEQGIQQIIKACQAHPDIDAVVATNPTIGDMFSESRRRLDHESEVSRPYHFIQSDISETGLHEVIAGRALAIIDQQPFLQGYLALKLAFLYKEHGVTPCGFIQTGPCIISKDNAQDVLRKLGQIR